MAHHWTTAARRLAACSALTAALATPYLPAAGLAGAEAATAPSAVPAVAADPVIAAAGDIACAPGSAKTATACHQAETATLLARGNYDAVLPVGDEQYKCGQASAFNSVYDPTWGAFNAKAYPVVGDNEYVGAGCSTPGASGYYGYFGSRAAPPARSSCLRDCPGYYSYDIGAWHLVALNSECGLTSVGGCAATDPMGAWLKADLAAHASTPCTLAYWHRPYWANGGVSAKFKPLVQVLYDGGVELLLVGHNHLYTRFAAQNPSGGADPNGVRQFTVGTGGVNHAQLKAPVLPNTQVRNNTTFGILTLTLHPSSYDFAFLNDGASGTFTDSGTAACHGGSTPAAKAPTVTTGGATNVTATGATLTGTVNPQGSATTYQFDLGTDTTYGSSTAATDAGAGTGVAAATATVSGLTSGTTYHYRLSATNTVGPTNGADQAFTASDPTGTCIPGSLTATDTADSFVYAGSPSTTSGGDTELKANNAGTTTEHTMFLDFATPALPAGCTAASATLTMVTGQSGVLKQQTIDVHGQDAATWDEATLSWTNRPAQGTDVATGLTFSLQTAGQQQAFALPAGAWLNPGGTTSLSVTSLTAAGKLFASKENTASAPPQLRIDYS